MGLHNCPKRADVPEDMSGKYAVFVTRIQTK